MAPPADESTADGDDSLLSGDRLLDVFGVLVLLAVIGGIVFVGLLVAGGDAGESVAPETAWNLTRVNDSHVKIVHAGGEPVETSKLLVTADGRERHPVWTAETLGEGDSGTFRATRARSLVRLWFEEGTDREVLGSWEIS